MPEAVDVFVKSTKLRFLIGFLGLLAIVGAVFLLISPVYSQPTWRWVALFFTVAWFYFGAIFLILAMWGGFPQWSHALMSANQRGGFAYLFRAYAAAQAARVVTYKWGNPRQILLVQLTLVPLVAWLSTLFSPLVALFGPNVWVVGASVGGLLAIVLKYLLKRR
jgi:hypothetical protein